MEPDGQGNRDASGSPPFPIRSIARNFLPYFSATQYLLLSLLVLILVATLLLATRIPRCYRHSISFHVEPTQQYGVVFLHRGHYAESQFGVLLFDLQNGGVSERYDEASDWMANRTRYSWSYDIRVDDAAPSTQSGMLSYELSSIDPDSLVRTPRGKFSFPDCPRTVAGNRYLIGHDQHGLIHAIDLEHLDRGVKSISHPTTELPMVPLFETDRFLLIRNEVPPGKVNLANPILRQVEMFAVDAAGSPQLITSWPIGAVNDSNFGACSYVGQQVASISPDCKQIEFHHSEDGRLTETFPLPHEFDPTTMSWSFEGDILVIRMPNENSWFNVNTQRWLPHPPNARKLLDRSDDKGMLVYSLGPPGGDIAVFHAREERTACLIPSPLESEAFLLGSDRVVVMSDQDLVTVRIHELSDGNVLASWQPYLWVRPLLAFLLAGFGIWVVAWLWVSATHQTPAWIDGLLIGGVPLLCLAIRAMWIGGVASLIPMEYARGIASAAYAAILTSSLLSRSRWSMRPIPVLLLLSALLCYASLVYVNGPLEGWYFVAFALLHGSLAALPWLICVLAGYRLGTVPTEPNAASSASQFRIADLFVWILTLSLLFASLKLAIDRMGPMQSYGFYFPFVRNRAVMLFLASAAAMLHFRGAQPVSLLLVITGYLFLISQPLERLQIGAAAGIYTHMNADYRVMVSGMISTYAFLSTHRLRGRYLTRKTPGVTNRPQETAVTPAS
ncbi:MAG: Hsp20/alpha crystallin family protein [Rubripirellula sp.]